MTRSLGLVCFPCSGQSLSCLIVVFVNRAVAIIVARTLIDVVRVVGLGLPERLHKVLDRE
jgi:hypothetical protein